VARYKNVIWRIGLHFFLVRVRSVTDFCEGGNELLVSIKGRKVNDQPEKVVLLNTERVTWSYVLEDIKILLGISRTLFLLFLPGNKANEGIKSNLSTVSTLQPEMLSDAEHSSAFLSFLFSNILHGPLGKGCRQKENLKQCDTTLRHEV
jgi:hypothetical protein